MTTASRTDSLLGPVMVHNATGYGLAINAMHDPFVYFHDVESCYRAFQLLDSNYLVGLNDDNTATVHVFADGDAPVHSQTFPGLSRAFDFVEEDFRESFTRPLIRYALTDLALAALADAQ